MQEYIDQFYSLYPNIINVMGGIVNLPQSSVVITASNIPADFIGLTTIQDYLWRFSYYSYAAYINYIASKQMTNDLLTKINNKKIELQSL
ncbi:MAG: hypothetical protein EOP34_10210 [Rickettsiales bacterium]|nr:MAG: hypothetical protein EOP34_10210 [Rickettsiales bacterium]